MGAASCRRPVTRGTRQALGLRAAAQQLGVSYSTAKRWWRSGLLVGGKRQGMQRARVIIPIEVVEFHALHLRLPTKRELFESGALTREFLLELHGPDGGLSSLGPLIELELGEDEHATTVAS